MKQIFRTKFGSHLYGTSTPASDIDFKSIFIPDGRSILLQRAKGAINDHRPKQAFEKNTAGEVEEERFSLQRYLSLLAEGQTVALDMLFAPPWAMTDDPSWEWLEIVENRDRLLTRKSKAFIGYAMKQASKYGVKGSRVAAGRAALSTLALALEACLCKPNDKLADIMPNLESKITETEHMSIVEIEMASRGMVKHWEVCGRKMPYTSSVKNALDIMQRLVDEYGKRAFQAESNQGVDWKALSHAVRVGRQAIELLQTGTITFPLPYADKILEIKLGQRDYRSVAEEIEQLLVEVEAAAASSSLPEEPDIAWIDDFVAAAHRDAVLSSR